MEWDVVDFSVGPSVRERVESTAEMVSNVVRRMQPGDSICLERHEEDGPNGLFTITVAANSGESSDGEAHEA